MAWAAREGIISIFLIFAVNAAVFVFLDKSLPLGIEAIGGIVSITVAAVGITTARGYLNDRQAWNRAGTPGVTVNYTPANGVPAMPERAQPYVMPGGEKP